MVLKQINWGIIGCGDVTEVKSGPAFNKIKNSRLVAVMRRSPGKAKDYAQRHNVPKWYDDAGKLIADPDINAIYVATPPSTHAKYTIMAAKAGKHIYVEKPMAMNHKECQQMITAANKAGVSLFVAYYRRCLPSFLKIKEWLDSGVIGIPRHVNIRLVKPVWELNEPKQGLPWRLIPKIAGGGLFVDLGSHQLDYLDYLLGPITHINAFRLNQTSFYPVEDMITANFMFASGAMGSGSWCFSASPESQTDAAEIIGSKGKIEFSTFAFTPIRLTSKRNSQILDYPKPIHVQEACINSVTEQLLGRGTCPSTGITASRTSRIIDLIYASGL